MLRKRKITLATLLVVFIVSLSCMAAFLPFGKNNVAVAASAIVDGDGVTVTENVTDPFDETKRGISVSATKNGAVAEFGKTFSDKFVIDLKAKGEKGEVPALKAFSLVFTERDTGDSFSLKVAYSNEKVQVSSQGKAENHLVTDISVIYGEERAGIYYRETNSMPYELTSGYNNQNKYTRFYYGENAIITFDAKNLVLSVYDKTAKNQNYNLKIWDFKKQVNDGKKLENDLDAFLNYNVSVVFDDIASGKTGELVVYGIADGNEDIVFDKDGIIDLYADIKYNAVVGQAYEIPEATVTKIVKDDKSAKATVTVKKGSSDVAVSDGKFTPTSESDYTIKYVYSESGKELASQEYKIKAVKEAKNDIALSSDFADITVGLNEKLYIPSATLSSNLNAKARNIGLSVSIKKNGEIVGKKSLGDIEYAFTSTGEYQIVYENVEFKYEKIYKVTVSAENLGIVEPDVPEVFEIGSTFTAEPLKAYINGEEIVSTVTLVYPSGREVVGSSFTLDELGDYTVKYSFTANGSALSVEKHFAAEKRLDSVFDYTDASVEYGVSSYNSALDGALFTVKNTSVITYKETIDVTKLFFDDKDSYANKNDGSNYAPLIEISAVPSLMGAADLTTIYVTLTDTEDETNAMVVRLRLAEAGSSLTKIRAKGKNQTYTGQNFKWNSTYTGIDSYIVENAAAHEYGGFSSSHNFTQTPGANNTSDTTCKLYYDFEKNAVYSKPAYAKLGADELEWLVCDFDDDRFFGTPWTGFRKGTAKLSVSFAGVEGSAAILIRSVNGEKLEGELVDDEIKPTMTFDLGGDEIAPLGQKGEKYRIPDFTAKDNSGIITNKSYAVYFNGKEIPTSGGYFTPNATGYYTIRYSATDSFGNTATEDLPVRVMSYVPKPVMDIDGTLPETAKFGDVITLPEISSEGGAGYIVKTVKVSCGDKNIEVKNGEFVCTETGTYIVSLQVTDHLGKTDERVYFIEVSYENSPTFNENELVLPPSFIGGEEYFFGKYYADYYASRTSSAEKIEARIIVDEKGAEKTVGADGKYVPTTDSSVTSATVKLVFERANAKTLTIEKVVPITQINEKAKFMEDYFLTENAETSSNSSQITFRALKSGENAEVSFIKPIYVQNLSVDLKIDEIAYENIIVTLRDSKNYEQSAEIRYAFEGEKAFAVIGGEKREITLKDGLLGVNLDMTTFDVTDKNGGYAGTIAENKNGSEFKGFESGYVYMTITLKGATEGAEIGLCRIGNQNFNYLGSDMVKPTLKVNGNLSGKVGINSTIVTPSAIADDVLFAVRSLKLTILDPNEEIVFTGSADRSYEVTLGKYGVYQFVYEAKDASKRANASPITKTITVYDPTAPTLTFDREMITEITVGYQYVLPSYTITDNAPAEECNVHITVINPRGLADTVTDGVVKFLYKGTYKITYFVIDADGNNNLYSFEITAKEA